MPGSGMRYDKARARDMVRATAPDWPAPRPRRDQATAKQLKRVAELAAEHGVDPPVPAGEQLTRREAGRFIDGLLIAAHRQARAEPRDSEGGA